MNGQSTIHRMDQNGAMLVTLVPWRDVRLVVKQTTGLFGLVRPRIESLFEDLPTAGRRMASLLMRRINGEPADSLQYIQPVSTSFED